MNEQEKGYFITIAKGLIKDPKHRKKMGSAVWEFIWLIDALTDTSGNGEGIGKVKGGRPIKLKEIADDLGIHPVKVSVNLTKLKDEGYINIVHAPYGLIITVNKAKKIFGQKVNPDGNKGRFNDNGNPVEERFNEKVKVGLTKRLTPLNEKVKPNKDNTVDNTKDNIDKSIQAKPEKEYCNPQINDISQYFLRAMDIPKEDCPQQQARRYWYLLLRESKTGVEGVKWLVDLASQDDYYKNNITSGKDLYYKRIKLIARKRGNTVNGKHAFFSEDGGGENVVI